MNTHTHTYAKVNLTGYTPEKMRSVCDTVDCRVDLQDVLTTLVDKRKKVDKK